MTAPEQPRDNAGRFASYVRPPVPPARPRVVAVSTAVDRAVDGPAVRQLWDSVPTSVVAVCCAGCVYGELS